MKEQTAEVEADKTSEAAPEPEEVSETPEAAPEPDEALEVSETSETSVKAKE